MYRFNTLLVVVAVFAIVFVASTAVAGTVHVLTNMTECMTINNDKIITITGPDEDFDGFAGITDTPLTISVQSPDSTVYEPVVGSAFDNSFIITNADYTLLFIPNSSFTVYGSTVGNDGSYVVVSVDLDGSDTVITVGAGLVTNEPAGAMTIRRDGNVFTIDNQTAGAVTIQNLEIIGVPNFDAVNITGDNASTVKIVNCDFPDGPDKVVSVLNGTGNGGVTIQYCNIGADAGATAIVGVENANAASGDPLTVVATLNWWNSYNGPDGAMEVYGGVNVRAAATTVNTPANGGIITLDTGTDGQYRVNTDTTETNDDTDVDDDGDTVADTAELAALPVATNPLDPEFADVYVSAAFVDQDAVNTFNIAQEPDDWTLVYGANAFQTITDGIAGVAP